MTHLLTVEYQSRQLALIQQLESDLQDKWKKFPVRLTEAEAEAACLDQVIDCLEGADRKERSPTGLAAIPADEVESKLLKSLDLEFRASIVAYRSMLKDATLEDLERIITNKRNFRVKEDFHFLWRWITFWGRPFIERADFERDTQAHRHALLIRIQTLEETRLATLRCQLEKERITCNKLLQATKEGKPERAKLLREISQLERVYSAVTKRDPPLLLQKSNGG